jgi:hypothetical protein
MGAGMASYQLTNLPLLDFGTLFNAVSNVPPVPATASFQVQWRLPDGTKRTVTKIRDAIQGYTGAFLPSTASIEWSAQEDGFSFVSDPAATSTSEYAQLGQERNGVFFPQGSGG